MQKNGRRVSCRNFVHIKLEVTRLCALTVAFLELAALVRPLESELTKVGEELRSSVDDRLLYVGILGLVCLIELVADRKVVGTNTDSSDVRELCFVFSHSLRCIEPFSEGFIHRAEYVAAEDLLGSGVTVVAVILRVCNLDLPVEVLSEVLPTGTVVCLKELVDVRIVLLFGDLGILKKLRVEVESEFGEVRAGLVRVAKVHITPGIALIEELVVLA